MYSEPLEGKDYKVRLTLLRCAFRRGAWQQLPVCVRPYIAVKQRKIIFYTEIIDECYEIIAELKEEGEIK